MIRIAAFLIGVALCMAGAGAGAQQAVSPGRMTMSPTAIGPIRAEWKQADLLASGFSVEREVTNIEGDEVYRYDIQVDAANKVEMWFLPDGRGFRLTTSSPAFATAEGAHVGATLAELRRRYPKGWMIMGLEEGRYFTFIARETKDRVVAFDFDPGGAPLECYTEGK